MVFTPKTGRAREVARRVSRSRRAEMRLEPLEQRQMFDAAYINEIYFDPPADGDLLHEYIELRGTPGMSLNDTYLIFLENENNPLNTGNPGAVEMIFNLSGQVMGSNGFLTLRQSNNQYSVAPGTTDLVNTSGTGWGGAVSSLNFQSENNEVKIENSGFTAMLIKNSGGAGNAPLIGEDLDVGNDGLDVPTGRAGWEILDSIGIHAEAGEAPYGRLYGKINFGPEATANVEPGAVYVGVGFEIEYVARWGNSTGQTADDWDVSNLTDNPLSGFQDQGDFRQSADPQGSLNVEASQDIPYGTNLTNTLGSVNYPGIIAPPTSVVGRHIFYNNSKFDNNTPAISSSDDGAIAPDRSPYFAGGGVAPLSSITSYSKGINGIMVDIADAAGTLTVNDFTFKVGSNNSLGTWTDAPAPTAFSVRPGAGVDGSDRVEITWADGAIKNTWLEVIVEGNDAQGGMNTNTGLAASDAFFFGNRVGDTQLNSPATVVTTTTGDELAARNNTAALVGITNIYDFDKNNLVSIGDQLAARGNTGVLTRISIPAPSAGPLAATDDSEAAVASALAISTPSADEKPVQLAATRLATIEAKLSAVAQAVSQLFAEQVPAQLQRGADLAREVSSNSERLIESLLDEFRLG